MHLTVHVVYSLQSSLQVKGRVKDHEIKYLVLIQVLQSDNNKPCNMPADKR